MRKPRSTGRSEHAEQHYLVYPRHLAGGGDLRHIADFLLASGWRSASSDGPLVLDSPDRTLRVGYDPLSRPGGWTIQGAATDRDDAWHVHLDQQAPVEIVAGITDALTRPRSAHAPNVWAPLEQHKWQAERGEHHVSATSPDRTAWVQYHQDQAGRSLWWAGAQDGAIGWTARFTSTTPMHLLQQFTEALAHPDPVMRPRGHVPPSPLVRTRSVSVLPTQLAAWKQARVAAARAATWARTPQGPREPRATAPPRPAQRGHRARP